jgi:hypothetical protein
MKKAGNIVLDEALYLWFVKKWIEGIPLSICKQSHQFFKLYITLITVFHNKIYTTMYKN